jgi:hypothetical protein
MSAKPFVEGGSVTPPPAAPVRRLLDKDACAAYLSASVDTVDRLIQAGELPVVRLPVERTQTGRGRVGVCRRILIDVRDLDALIERSKERAR